MSVAAMPGNDEAVRGRSSTWLLAVALLALTGLVYFQTWRELWPFWTDSSSKRYTHGILIAAVSGWLIWRARQRLAAVPMEPVSWALPLTFLVSLAWMMLARAGIVSLHSALWPALAAAGLLAACGWRVLAALAFPLGYLWFAVPVWDHLNRPLQSLTVIAVDGLNRLTQVPAVVSGDMVIIPEGRFEIASGCSGLHYFVVALAIATLAGELRRDRIGTRLLLVATAAALALVTNWLRVYLIILAGHLTDMQHYLVRVDHYKFGWVMFAISMVAFFFFLNRWPEPNEDHVEPRIAGSTPHWQRGYAAAVFALLVVPASSLAASLLGHDRGDRPFSAPSVDGFEGPLRPTPVWQPSYRGAETEVRAAYLSATGRVVDYYGNRYLEQSQGRELIGYGNSLLDGDVFDHIEESQNVYTVAGIRLPVIELTAELRGGQGWLVMYHYRVGGAPLVGALQTQLTYGYRSLWGRVPAGISAAAAPCANDCDAVREELARLLGGLLRNDP